MALMFLNGEGMSGGAAHHHITGATFLGEVTTAPAYRFLAFGRHFPGLLPVSREGSSIEGELYEVPMPELRNLLDSEPPELELSIVELSDGRLSFGMVVRTGRRTDAATDITKIASWRRFLRGG